MGFGVGSFRGSTTYRVATRGSLPLVGEIDLIFPEQVSILRAKMPTISPKTSFESLNLCEGDGVTAVVENGQIMLTVHTAEEISELETSLDEARAQEGSPLNQDYFDGLREKFGPKN